MKAPIKSGMSLNPVSAFLRFHLRGGTRLSLRVFIPLGSVYFAAFLLFGPEFSYSLMGALLEGGYLLSALPTTIITVTVAVWAGRRVCFGASGWILHLPVTSVTSRRAAVAAVWVALTPLLLILAALSLSAASIYHVAAVPYVAGLPLAGAASALFVFPVKRKIAARPLALLASLCFSSGDWIPLCIGLLFLAAADAVSGPLVPLRRYPLFSTPFSGRFLHFFIAWRALRLRLVIPYLFAFFPLLPLYFFIANNPYDPAQARMAIRLGGAMSLVLFCGSICHLLGRQRPPWPWSRSLPWSSRRRILWDSSFIGIHLLPLMIVFGLIAGAAIPPLLAGLPTLVIFSSFAVREYSQRGGSGQIVRDGTLVAFLVAMAPSVSLILLLLVPLILKQAVTADLHLKVSSWQELSHMAAGDTLSWSR